MFDNVIIGEVRFFTKVIQNSPSGLRLLLFKEKATGNEKLVFLVKTASELIDKLPLSKMTWQLEQSKAALRVVIVRLLILPDDSDNFFKTETGLIMNDAKDRRSLESLETQNSVEIYFFNMENEFNSKIELLTTFNMKQSVKRMLDANPEIDEGKMIVKSENLSEYDIKKTMNEKFKGKKLRTDDLMDSIQKKMPTVSSSGILKTKPEEHGKASIKTNDVLSDDNFGVVSKTPPKQPVSQRITPEDLMRTIPPKNKANNTYSVSFDDLLKTIPPGKLDNQYETRTNLSNTTKLTPEDLLKSISPESSKLRSEDLMKTISSEKQNSSSSSEISFDDLFKTIPPEQIKIEDVLNKNFNIKANLKPEDLLKSISSDLKKLNTENNNKKESSITMEDLLKSVPPDQVKLEDLLKVPDSSITMQLKPEDLLKTISPNLKTLTPEDLLKTIPPEQSKIGSITRINAEDLLKTLSPEKSKIKVNSEPNILSQVSDGKFDSDFSDILNQKGEKMESKLNNDNLDEKNKKSSLNDKINTSNLKNILDLKDNVSLSDDLDLNKTVKLTKDEINQLFSALQSEPSPLKEEVKVNQVIKYTEEEEIELMNAPTPLKDLLEQSEIEKITEGIDATIKIDDVLEKDEKKEDEYSIDLDDLFNILNDDN